MIAKPGSAELEDLYQQLGPLQAWLRDPDVTEIMVNGPNQICIERRGEIELTGDQFESDEELMRVLNLIVRSVGRRIDVRNPLCDARLPDGSRVNAVIPPLSLEGPLLTIRKHASDSFSVDDLLGLRTLTSEAAAFLKSCVLGKCNIIVSGGTNTGKTTLLNVLSGFIPEKERIVTIEDNAELQLRQWHVVRLESRPPNLDGEGRVGIRELVANALRMRPDRIIVGECRGEEALDMLQAMNTGHDGSLTTLHANSPRDALARLETMVLMAGLELPTKAIRQQMASAIQVIVQLSRLRDGSRRVAAITEVMGMEGEIITLQDVFTLETQGGVDDGPVIAVLKPSGIRPASFDRLAVAGVSIPPELLRLYPNSRPPGVGTW